MIASSIGLTILYIALISVFIHFFLGEENKKNDNMRELWLLARFPRPVVVFVTMLIHGLIDAAGSIICLSWLAFVLVLFVLSGWTGAVIFIGVTLGSLFILLGIEEAFQFYQKIDGTLPKREKKKDDPL